MPKNKTHSGAKKRFRLTGSGKIKRQHVNMRHNLEKMASKRQRRLNADAIVDKHNYKEAKKLLGI